MLNIDTTYILDHTIKKWKISVNCKQWTMYGEPWRRASTAAASHARLLGPATGRRARAVGDTLGVGRHHGIGGRAVASVQALVGALHSHHRLGGVHHGRPGRLIDKNTFILGMCRVPGSCGSDSFCWTRTCDFWKMGPGPAIFES